MKFIFDKHSISCRKFLTNSNHIERDSYIWNMAGSMLVSFQSVIMLMFLTRVLGLKEAGIFTIAYANASLLMSIGKFGMRNFQVSDVTGQFTFQQYLLSRIMTCGAMIMASIAGVIYLQHKNGYSFDKSMIILCVCLLKSIEAMEDVFHGLYQQRNRLDVAGKSLTVRMILTIIVFGLCLFLLNNLLETLVITTIFSTIIFILFTKWTYANFHSTPAAKSSSIKKLMSQCFPLFVGAFLALYIGNAPKYAIDSILTDELQACYGFISMPVFVIGLLNGFIFNPILYKMSILWERREIKAFIFQIIRQTGVIILITVICIFAGYICGIPILSWLYNTDLTLYKKEFLILLCGGGLLGLSGFLNTLNTIIRQQRKLMWGYLFIALLAVATSKWIVEMHGILGAAVLYLVLMGGLCLIFTGLLLYNINMLKGSDQYV